MRTNRYTSVILAAGLVMAAAAPAAAQETPFSHFSAAIGLFQFELAESGLAPMLAVRGGRPVASVLLLEGSLVASRPEQLGATSTFLAPEAQFQLSLPFTGLQPYIGLGGGAAVDMRNADLGGTRSDFTISGSLGLRTWLGERMGIIIEFRARGIGFDFSSTSAEYTVGTSWRP